MKKKLLFLLFLYILCIVPDGYTQVHRSSLITQGRQPSEVRFSNTSAFLQGDTLFVTFDYTVRGRVLSAGEALHIVPVYRAGEREIRLPEILINGKKRAKYYRRERALISHDEYWERKPFALLTLDGHASQKVAYSISQIIPRDMRRGHTLEIEQFVEDCCDLKLVATLPVKLQSFTALPLPETTESKVGLAATRPVYESSVTFIRPQKEVVKERNEHLTLRINYMVDRYDVLPHYAGNADELQKVESILRPLSSRSETYRITAASIKGYASPEAPYEYNLRLSQHRAESFKQYLINRYGLYNLPNFPATGMGEDWDGLRRAVERSDMMYRGRVLSIIDGVGIFNGREKRLMELAGGDPYRYMMQNFYPALRRMEMDIAYTVRSFETAEAEEIINDRPQDLSQEEIYEVARKRKAQAARNEYGREYDVAARYFPGDATANINASSAALVRGDLDETWHYLSKVRQVPQAYNNLGVFYWLSGDTTRAAEYFRRALEVKGDKERAARNLQVLEQCEQRQTGEPFHRRNTSNEFP